MSMKKTIAGPNSLDTVYEMPFNEKNVSIGMIGFIDG
jgi:hypothetical protein